MDKNNEHGQNLKDNTNLENKRARKFLQNPKIKNNEQVIMNKEIDNIIKYKETPRKEVLISFSERFKYSHCCKSSDLKEKEIKGRIELIIAAEEVIGKKSEIFEIWKIIDQLRLLTKLLLNKNQTFMIQNRNFHSIINPKKKSIDLNHFREEKYEENTKDLMKYLKEKKEKNELNAMDLLLFKYLDEDLKQKVKGEVNI